MDMFPQYKSTTRYIRHVRDDIDHRLSRYYQEFYRIFKKGACASRRLEGRQRPWSFVLIDEQTEKEGNPG